MTRSGTHHDLEIPMLTHSIVARLVAKPERSEDVATFLAGALTLAEEEDFTPVWFALRADENTFYIVDAFASAEDRGKHINGPIAAALMSKAPELFAEPPSIAPVDILAAKVTVGGSPVDAHGGRD